MYQSAIVRKWYTFCNHACPVTSKYQRKNIVQGWKITTSLPGKATAYNIGTQRSERLAKPDFPLYWQHNFYFILNLSKHMLIAYTNHSTASVYRTWHESYKFPTKETPEELCKPRTKPLYRSPSTENYTYRNLSAIYLSTMWFASATRRY